MRKPKIGDKITQPPVLKGGKTTFWTVTHVHAPVPIDTDWSPEFRQFFNDVGIPALWDFGFHDECIGTMENEETKEQEELTEIFWKLFS